MSKNSNKTEFNYSEFIDRNWAFVNKELQTKIKTVRILFAGCGLGSVIVETATRLGFLNFILVDGDKVELSNLNRQIFNKSHIGINKASATDKIIKKINPQIKTMVIKTYIQDKDVSSLVKQCDIIINTVDVGTTYFNLVKIGQKYNKHIFLPLNIGYGGFNIIFNKETRTLEDILKLNNINNDLTLYKVLIKKLGLKKILPLYITKNIDVIFRNINHGAGNPQVAIGAQITSAITVTAILKILSGIKIPLAPHFIYCDIYKNI